MNAKTLSLMLASVLLSALAQIVLKAGMSSRGVQTALATASRFETAWVVGTNPYVIGGLAMYGLGAALWLLVLARLDVSLAYPFVALGFVVTMAFGIIFLGEAVSGLRVAGTLMVAVGVFLIASS